jgi:endonuclease YncB( thermonuclease family)
MRAKKIKIKYFFILVAVTLIIFALLFVYVYRRSSLYSKPKFSEVVLPVENSNLNRNENINFTQCAEQPVCISKVTYVYDGDTVEISTGERVRYIGIDATEVQHGNQKAQCFSGEAAEKNKELVLNKEVKLEKDVSDKDKYGRLLRYVYLPAGEAGVGNIFVNKYLTRFGFAYDWAVSPDVKFSQELKEAQNEARANQRGLWAPGTCP